MHDINVVTETIDIAEGENWYPPCGSHFSNCFVLWIHHFSNS